MDRLLHFVREFKGKKIMVVGDLIADEFIEGEPERISREAPVLILKYRNRSILPGGGSNAAHNLAALGADVRLVGVVGDDSAGRELSSYLEARGVDTSGVFVDPSRPTTVKTRVLAGSESLVKQQVVRIDQMDNSRISPELEEKVLTEVQRGLQNCSALLISDYGLGLFTPRLKKEIVSTWRNREKIITLDSRYDLAGFPGVTVATPNREETEQTVGFPLTGKERIRNAGVKLLEILKSPAVVITLGGQGMALFEPGREPVYIPPTNFTEVYDVTGAGDTVISALTLSLTAGTTFLEGALIASHAAGVVVRKAGVAVCTVDELLNSLQQGGQDHD